MNKKIEEAIIFDMVVQKLNVNSYLPVNLGCEYKVNEIWEKLCKYGRWERMPGGFYSLPDGNMVCFNRISLGRVCVTDVFVISHYFHVFHINSRTSIEDATERMNYLGFKLCDDKSYYDKSYQRGLVRIGLRSENHMNIGKISVQLCMEDKLSF